MTAPKPPTEAHDEAERELARILRALPAGEPSPELDARILRSAANAAASSRKPQVRWFASTGGLWGIGAAAAAVLALGVSWQMLDPARGFGGRPSPVSVSPGSDGAIVVERGETRRDAPPMPGAPAAIAPSPARAQDSSSPMAKSVASQPSQPAPQVSAADIGSAESSAVITAAQLGTVDARQRKAAESNMAARDAAGAREQSADLAGVAVTSLPPPGPMKPAAWLAQVRQLVSANRTDEARASLELFHKRYPNYVLPADLALLLRQ